MICDECYAEFPELHKPDCSRDPAKKKQRSSINDPKFQERIRELEWAATYLKNNKKRQGCRCAGSCDSCKEFKVQSSKISAETVLELIQYIKDKNKGIK